MKRLLQGLTAAGLLAIGYGLGSVDALSPAVAPAQVGADEPTSETVEQVKRAGESLLGAKTALAAENRYTSAITTLNGFAVTAGGIDALADLEAGQAVDPVTFAGLYAGLATDEVAPHVGRDENGRLTYKSKVVRMYPISRLKQVFGRRAVYLGEVEETE